MILEKNTLEYRLLFALERKAANVWEMLGLSQSEHIIWHVAYASEGMLRGFQTKAQGSDPPEIPFGLTQPRSI